MPIPQTFHGTVYQIPVQGDLRWAPPLTRYLVALGTYAMTSTGGTFTLTGDLNLGNSFGIFAKYFTSGSTLPSTVGSIRLANLDTVGWRNFANSGNLLLGVNGSDQLTFDGAPLQPLLSLTDGQMWIGDSTNTPIGRTLSGDVTVTDLGATSIGALKVTNAMVSNSAAIAYGKLALTGSIVNNDIYSSAAIAYSKLSLSASIVNGDIATGAAIDYSKLAALTANRVLLSDGSGLVSVSSITNTTLGYLDATSSIQSQINGKQASLAGLTTDGVMYATSATAVASTAAGTTGQFLAANTGGAPTWGTPIGSGTVNSGTATDLAYYAATGTAVSDASGHTISGTYTFSSAITASITGHSSLDLALTGGTMSGAIAMGANKITVLANGTAATDAAAVGQLHVLQSPLYSSTVSGGTVTSTSFLSAGPTVTITPTSTSSKIFIMVAGPMSTTLNYTMVLGIQGTASGDIFSYPACPFRLANILNGTITSFALDSPGTVSPQTYTARIAVSGGTGTYGNATATGAQCSIFVVEMI